MYIHDFFQNFLKTFLVCFHGAFTSILIAQDIPPGGWPTGRTYEDEKKEAVMPYPEFLSFPLGGWQRVRYFGPV